MKFSTLKQQFPYYLQLIRFNRPIGTYLLLWPTLWALWFAAKGIPDLSPEKQHLLPKVSRSSPWQTEVYNDDMEGLDSYLV